MKIKTLFILLVFSILSLSSCKYFKKCEGVEDIYSQMDANTNAFFHFQPGERMVFTNGNGVYDTAYWGEAVRYYDKNDPSSYSCIGRKGDCCAKQYFQHADQPLKFTSGDENKPTKMHYGSRLVLAAKGQSELNMNSSIRGVGKYKGVIYDDFCVNGAAKRLEDTTLAYSVSKGILFIKITNDDKTVTIWERVF